MSIVYPITLSFFIGGVKVNTPRTRIIHDRSDLLSLFKFRPPKYPLEKKRNHCWSPALFENGRLNENVTELSLLTYDIDETTILPHTAHAFLKEAKLAHIIHTSWSHREETDTTPAIPKYRIILFPDRMITAAEFANVWSNGRKLIGSIKADVQAKDPARIYFLPYTVTTDSDTALLYHLRGNTVNVDALAVNPKRERMSNKTPAQAGASKPKLTNLSDETLIELETGETLAAKEIKSSFSPGKYKCACPIESGASMGSAFLRVTEDSRLFVQCTSSNHKHEGKQFWLKDPNKKGKSSTSVKARKKKLEQLPPHVMKYIENGLAYVSGADIFVRRMNGAWDTGLAMNKAAVTTHIQGLLNADNLDYTHARAAVDHVISRQVYGYDVSSVDAPVFRREKGSAPLLNLYCQPRLKLTDGEFPLIKEMIQVIAGDDGRAGEWLINWTAALVQSPERRGMVAVLCMSEHQGIGKSLYGVILSHIIGQGNCATVSNRALRDSFNAAFVTKLFVIANEVGIDRRAADVMTEIKTYITDPEVYMSNLYSPRINIINRMSWWMTTNEKRPVLLEKKDRRFTVLQCSEPTEDYTEKLRESFESETGDFTGAFLDEICAFGAFLKTYSVDYQMISRPFENKARVEIQRASLNSLDSFLLEVQECGINHIMARVETGNPKSASLYAQDYYPVHDTYKTYQAFCQETGRRGVRPMSELVLHLTGAKIGRRKVKKVVIPYGTSEATCLVGMSRKSATRAKGKGTVVSFPK